jgi:hypothetical protein
MQCPKEKWKCKKIAVELILLRNQVAMAAWNVWRRRMAGGFISAGVQSVGTSDAATVLRVSMHQSMRRQRATRS